MEYEISLNENETEKEDIIYTKIQSALNESKNILHKKALILIKSIHSQYDPQKLVGLDGIQLYTKTFIDLLLKIVNKYSEINEKNLEEDELIEDTLNFEALIFTLAICCKNLNYNILHNNQLIQRIINIVNFGLGLVKSKKIIFRVNNYCFKYILNIIETFLLSRSNEELSNDKDEIVLFFKNIYMKILIICMKLKPELKYKDEYDVKNINFNVKDLHSSLLKIICGLIQKKGELIQFSIIYEVISYITKQIQNINSNLKTINNNQSSKGTDNISSSILNTVNNNEIANVLLFLSGLIQFLPYDFFNDILKQLITLIQNINSEEEIEEKNDTIINIMINCLLCIDISFSIHELSEDVNEKTLTILLNKNIFSHVKNNDDEEFIDEKEENKKNKKYKISGDIYDKLIIAYLKAISSIAIKVSNNDYFKSLQYFIGILSKYSEVLLESNNFVKNSIFNVLQNLIQKLFDVQKISKLKIMPENNNNHNKNKLDIGNLDINENKKEGITENIILSKVAKILLYFVSSRFTEKKIGYNLLLLFIEKINQAKKINNNFYQHINFLNEDIIYSMSEINAKEKSDLHKIFIGKCFNYINSNIILKYYPLGILDYDIEKDDYTESSNVWIISYIDKFLLKEDGIQTIEDYVKSFMEPINEIEHMIIKLKVSPVKNENEENMEIQEDEDNDEKFEVNVNETKHMRELKIKRYQLIMTQIFMQIVKFTNYCQNYSQYINAFITKFKRYYENKESCQFLLTNLNEITFKFLYKIIQVAKKHNDEDSINIIRENGVFFFEKILNFILNDKLNKSETSLGFNVINKFCMILSKQNIIKIIINMIQKFDTKINSIFNNESNNNEQNNKGVIETSKKQKEKNDKEMNKLAIRLEIADYLLKNIDFKVKNPSNGNNTNSEEDNMISIVLQFFDKYFFFFSDNKNVKISKEGISSLQPLLTKKFFEIFYDVISKSNDIDYILLIFNKFTKDKKGLTLITSKQQSKIFEFIINQIIKKNETLKDITFNNINISLELLIAIASLTKDINKKVRNTSFEILGNITSFCTRHNILEDWIKINISLLSSKNAFVESAGINSLSRIFWENRNLEKTSETIISNSEAVLAYFPYNNKEIIKSLFLYVRVLLYIIKTIPPKNKKTIDTIINKVIFATTQQMNEQMQKEFKVKLRNLFKNLIINYGYDYVKNAIDAKNENLKNFVQYVNKNIVKKFNNNQENEDNDKLDNTVMMDNDNNLLDEEEDYIKNEFKKINKPEKEAEKKFFEKIEKLNIGDDDLDEVRKKELESIKKVENKKEEKIDKIEELFKKDYVNLNNFFYVNPFASGNNMKYDEQKINKDKKEEKKNKKDEKEKDVIYDTKQGKFIIKDLEKEIEISKLNKKRKRKNDEKLKELKYQNQELEKQALMKNKKVANVMKDDLLDLNNDNSDDDDENTKNRRKKISEKEYKKISTPQTAIDSHGKKTSHYVKYSGEEYKSKKGKGDKIIQGKYDPFAYIQLNPKSLNSKGERENAKIWADLMKNDNK